jgi:hypothetical protein
MQRWDFHSVLNKPQQQLHDPAHNFRRNAGQYIGLSFGHVGE